LSVSTVWSKADSADEDGECVSKARFLLSPAPGTHWMIYQRRLLVLERYRRDLQSGGSSAFAETLTISIIGGTRAMIEGVLRAAQESATEATPGTNILTARYESWSVTSRRARRPLASIVLADGMLEDLLEDMRSFLQSESWYAARGIPHRRGYLLYGPPGTGKTTVVAAVAGELRLSVAVLSLSSAVMNDESLRSLVDALPPAAVLLIEDIDCAFAAKREGGPTGVTMSGLLNALDGVSTRDGRALFLTTNHPERLDPALVRPGRVDRSFHLGHATPDQARRLFAWFYTAGAEDAAIDRLSRDFAARVPSGRICVAAIQEHLLRYRRDPEGAVRALDDDCCWDLPPGTPVQGVSTPLAELTAPSYSV
jgi:chaperone BCS1